MKLPRVRRPRLVLISVGCSALLMAVLTFIIDAASFIGEGGCWILLLFVSIAVLVSGGVSFFATSRWQINGFLIVFVATLAPFLGIILTSIVWLRLGLNTATHLIYWFLFMTLMITTGILVGVLVLLPFAALAKLMRGRFS